MDSVALVFSDYRMFGKVELHQGREAPPWWKNLPPQPQETAFDKALFRSILRKRSRKPLKALLLEQDAFPGIGNWMADEILWRARIHPARRPQDLSPYFRYKLFNAIKEVCEDAFRVIATDWGDPPDTWLFNHRWKRGTTCPVSNKPLEWITIVDHHRRTDHLLLSRPSEAPLTCDLRLATCDPLVIFD
jgi:formamidopyrimidine-DNA glycosylase